MAFTCDIPECGQEIEETWEIPNEGFEPNVMSENLYVCEDCYLEWLSNHAEKLPNLLK
ncbi:MAG: hypothetical protein WC455_10470 [Dehalococcoidia bacterium]|jgi:hypothetical protein